MTIIIISLSLLLLVSLIFLIRSEIRKNKLKKKYDSLVKQNDTNLKKLKIATENLHTPNIGYYETSLNLVIDKEKKIYDKYDLVVYVKELDRYTNGECKIELTSLEVVCGFDPNQFDWVKKSISAKFRSIRKISDITWLESEDAIKDLRRRKLKEIEGNTLEDGEDR